MIRMLEFLKQFSANNLPGRWGGGVVLRISSDGDDRRIFLGLKVLIPGFFWVGKFGKYFLWGWLDLSGDFWGIHIFSFWKFLGLGNSAWDLIENGCEDDKEED